MIRLDLYYYFGVSQYSFMLKDAERVKGEGLELMSLGWAGVGFHRRCLQLCWYVGGHVPVCSACPSNAARPECFQMYRAGRAWRWCLQEWHIRIVRPCNSCCRDSGVIAGNKVQMDAGSRSSGLAWGHRTWGASAHMEAAPHIELNVAGNSCHSLTSLAKRKCFHALGLVQSTLQDILSAVPHKFQEFALGISWASHVALEKPVRTDF